jgi:hypothetical protein
MTQMFLIILALAAVLGLAWRGGLLTLSGTATVAALATSAAVFDWAWFKSLCSQDGGTLMALLIIAGYSLLYIGPTIAAAMVFYGLKSMWIHRT